MTANIFNKAIASIKPVVLLTFVTFSLLNLIIVLVNHYFFRTVALDYAIYNFAFFDYAHLRISPCPAYIYSFPATFFQDHFSLTLILLSPMYWIMSPVTGTYSLLILQWLFIVLGACYTYKIIESKANNYKLALCAVIYYFLMLGRYTAYRGDVNLAIIGSSFVPVFLYYFESRRIIPTLVCFVLLLVNREDYALWLFFISFFLLILHREDRFKRRISFWLMISSAVFFSIIFKVIFPAIEDENKKFSLFNYAIVGETPLQVLKYVVTHPLKAIEYLFINHTDEPYYNGIKMHFYLIYLISGGFILILRPVYLLPFLPLIAKKMYDDNPLRWSTETYYSIEFVSILPVLVFWIISDLNIKKKQILLGTTICVLTLSATLYAFFIPVSNPIFGESNKSNFLSADFYKSDLDLNGIRSALKILPKDAAVSASCRILPHLTYREKVYYFPKINDAKYVFLLKNGDEYPLNPEEFKTETNKLLESREWEILQDKKDFILFKRM